MLDDILKILRGSVRPVVSIIFAATIAQVVVERIDAPQWFIGMAVTVILSWFTERTVKAVKGTTEAK